MPSASFQTFEVLTEDLASGVHDFSTDTIRAYLSNVAPNLATHTVKADIAEVATGNGYTGAVDTLNTLTRTGATTTITGTNIEITAAGGALAQFRYAILFNDDTVSDRLIGAWDYGEAIIVGDGEKFRIEFPSQQLVLRLPV